ncbi:glycosyltransferase [Azospirillum sp. TSO22-1]|uniref:glycosyltransferase family 2 protein n=1 Tax=Azospirillum sp. TSO22-1 TaxID=716789 RepID=UPI000D622368|nr:glycosyltransferase [Azospirillum sp. TSO22-1]PWC55362.1 hypothetical protein TSO221_05440 [Azospirillum sp. TSO22-1]
MTSTPLYVLSAPPALAQALTGRGFAVQPVRWDAERHTLVAASGPSSSGEPLHVGPGAAPALQDRWLLAAAAEDLPPLAAYARCYGLRLAALGGEDRGGLADLVLPPGDDWAVAAEALADHTGLRWLAVWSATAEAPEAALPGLGPALRRLGVALAGWPAPEPPAVSGGLPADWVLVPDQAWADRPGAVRGMVDEAHARGFRVAFLCRGGSLPAWPPDGNDPATQARVELLAALADADAVLTDSEAAAAALLAAGRRLLPKLNGLSWRVAACPPPAEPADGVNSAAWRGHARAVAAALVRRAPATAPIAVPADDTDNGAGRPVLTIAITTYNRSVWLAASLRRVLERTRPYADAVEVLVCDNASTDNTPSVVARFAGEPHLRTHRNPVNVGMLGNLGVTARLARGRFVWLLGDDDLLVDGTVEDVLEGILRHPDIHMVYLNYACTGLKTPPAPEDEDALVRSATPVADGGPNRYVPALRTVAALHENLFTAIYTCIFRRDHALLAYGQDVAGPPFSSLECSAPSAPYALKALLGRPAYWVGRPGLVVNLNVSWKEHGLLWLLERMPELCDLAERMGADPAGLDACRANLCRAAAENVRALYFSAGAAARRNFSLARLLERCKHLDDFRYYQVPLLWDLYRRAHSAGLAAGEPPPEELFAQYGLPIGEAQLSRHG